MARIFISYSKADSQFVEEFVSLLEEAFPEHTVWYDKHIYGGQDWWQLILSEIDRSDLLIYLLSNDSLKSTYCQAEWQESRRLHKPWLPVLARPKTDLDRVTLDDLQQAIHRTQWIDLSKGFRDASINAKLFGTINGLLRQAPASPPTPLTPTPISEPSVTPPQPQPRPTRRSPDPVIVAAIIGLVGALLAAVITVVLPSIINRPTEIPTTTAVPSTLVVFVPTADPIQPSTATQIPTFAFTPANIATSASTDSAASQAFNSYALGIDTSHFNQNVEWAELNGKPISFVILKATEGTSLIDPAFDANWKALKTLKIIRGAYHIFSPCQSATQQATNFAQYVNLEPGDLPAILVVQPSTPGSKCTLPDPATLSSGVRSWLELIDRQTGHKPIIYTSTSFWNQNVTGDFSSYPLWVANYGATPPIIPTGWTTWTFWQYTDGYGGPPGTQKVAGDRFNGSLDDLRAFRSGTQVNTPTLNSSIKLDVPWVSIVDGLNFPAGGQASVLMLLEAYKLRTVNSSLDDIGLFLPLNQYTGKSQLIQLAHDAGPLTLTYVSGRADNLVATLRDYMSKRKPLIILIDYVKLTEQPFKSTHYLNRGSNSVQHWMVVVGMDGDNFEVNDSLWGSKDNNGKGGKNLLISSADLLGSYADQILVPSDPLP